MSPRKKVTVAETPSDEPSPEDVAAMAALPDDEEETEAEYLASLADESLRDPAVEMVECPQCQGQGFIPAVPPVVTPSIGEHALDRAPVNSKIVVTDEGAMLAGPSGVIALLKSDPANRLPEGARILKLADDHYLATQLNPAVDQPAMTRTSAGAAIAAFVDHFHPRGLHG